MPQPPPMPAAAPPWRPRAPATASRSRAPATLALALGAEAALACDAIGPVHRYDDDARCLVHSDGDAWERAKVLEFGSAYVALGGELRARVEHTRNRGLGLEVQGRETVRLGRALVHGDLRLAPTTRVFVQFGAHEADGRRADPSPTDANGLDLQQAFAEFARPLADGRATLRLGRQELAFGSQRLTTVREGPNVRLAFDAVRLGWSRESLRVDAFHARPLRLERGAFDDGRADGQAFWGLYATRGTPARGLDLYYLGFARDAARFDTGLAREHRHSLGTRAFGRAAGWDWDLEAVWQFGRYGDGDLRAWTVASIVGRTFDAPYAPRLSLSANVATGDRRPDDAVLGTFNPLYPRAPYFTEASINAPANFVNLKPALDLRPHPRLALRASVDVLWRHSTRDAVYAQPLAPAIPGSASRARHVGVQSELRAQWTPRPEFSTTAAWVAFDAGPFVRDGGGRDQAYALLSTTFRF